MSVLIVLLGGVYQDTRCPVRECTYIRTLVVLLEVYIRRLGVPSGSVYQDTGCPARECISVHWLSCTEVYIMTLTVLQGSVYQDTG